ncbi:MAG: hypothetical protein JWN70_6381 [Planctomycetaceae bacterium]|nr:hypothetical protein [Planctomycetaceae bacterium]
MVKKHRTVKPERKQAATQQAKLAEVRGMQNRYRVGSLTKSSRLLWAYNEEMTFPEAEAIAASSRLTVLPPGSVPATARLLPLPPRASQRLAKFRQDGEGEPVECDVYLVVSDTGTVLKATESEREAEIYRKGYGEYHDGKKTATIRKARVTF